MAQQQAVGSNSPGAPDIVKMATDKLCSQFDMVKFQQMIKDWWPVAILIVFVLFIIWTFLKKKTCTSGASVGPTSNSPSTHREFRTA
jgi:hypothetical protein